VKNSFSNNYPIINLYKKNTSRSKIDTQLLYGENFKVIKRLRGWKKIKIQRDGYIGYIKNKIFSKPIRTNFKVSVLKSRLFKKPSNKEKTKKFMPYQARVKIYKKYGKFSKFDKYWIKTSHLKKNGFRKKHIFKDIELFKNTKYLWGGKSYKGIDCSALVQIFFNQNNKYCPRDSKDQEKYFKKKIKIENIKKNDLIFWKGHVAIAISKNKLIHAYGPMKKVVVMNIKKTIKRIEKTANLKVVSIRRP
jgi:cell wall-associated NlpC family hydrolase|tara:strand:- start:721 stop:1464 length:744 start_codon:yes stop_codon:yes gene_type:complete